MLRTPMWCGSERHPFATVSAMVDRAFSRGSSGGPIFPCRGRQIARNPDIYGRNSRFGVGGSQEGGGWSHFSRKVGGGHLPPPGSGVIL